VRCNVTHRDASSTLRPLTTTPQPPRDQRHHVTSTTSHPPRHPLHQLPRHGHRVTDTTPQPPRAVTTPQPPHLTTHNHHVTQPSHPPRHTTHCSRSDFVRHHVPCVVAQSVWCDVVYVVWCTLGVSHVCREPLAKKWARSACANAVGAVPSSRWHPWFVYFCRRTEALSDVALVSCHKHTPRAIAASE
jgi:hypothetical protein